MGNDKRPLLSNRLKLFMATMILANVAGNMWRPLLPLYLQDLGADVGQIGLFFTLGSIAPLLFQVFGGWLSDAIGRFGVLGFSPHVHDRRGALHIRHRRAAVDGPRRDARRTEPA